jgi:hypothetical protein
MSIERRELAKTALMWSGGAAIVWSHRFRSHIRRKSHGAFDLSPRARQREVEVIKSQNLSPGLRQTLLPALGM